LRQKVDHELVPELEAIATAAAERLRAQTDGDPQREAQLQRSVAETASVAIGAGLSLGTIADAERIGQSRVREELGRDVLRAVERAAGRKREADHAYERAVVRAGRLGLAHRDVASAAQVAHGTVRAILARTQTPSGTGAAATTTAAVIEADAEQRSADASSLSEVAAGQTQGAASGA
jgi:hypothetical protein